MVVPSPAPPPGACPRTALRSKRLVIGPGASKPCTPFRHTGRTDHLPERIAAVRPLPLIVFRRRRSRTETYETSTALFARGPTYVCKRESRMAADGTRNYFAMCYTAGPSAVRPVIKLSPDSDISSRSDGDQLLSNDGRRSRVRKTRAVFVAVEPITEEVPRTTPARPRRHR